VNPFFDELGALLAQTAAKKDVSIDAPAMDDRTSSELLDLARVVAHTRERRFAPLACYLAGIAVANMRTKKGDVDVAAFVKDVRAALESREDKANNPV
jgi:hypothetical protein